MKNIITLTEGNRKHILPIENILRMDSVGAYTIIYMKDGKQYVSSKHLGEVEKFLQKFTTLADVFYRVHRSHMINLKEVISYQVKRGGKVTLSDHAAVRIATRRQTELIQLLKKLKGK